MPDITGPIGFEWFDLFLVFWSYYSGVNKCLESREQKKKCLCTICSIFRSSTFKQLFSYLSQNSIKFVDTLLCEQALFQKPFWGKKKYPTLPCFLDNVSPAYYIWS